MKTMNRVFTTVLGLVFVLVSILGFSEEMFWGSLLVLLCGGALIFGAVSGRFWVRPL